MLVLAWALLCLRLTGVGVGDSLRFGAYVVLGLSLPGTLLWRMLVARGPRPWLEDIVLGTVLAYAAEIAAYLVFRSVGLPVGTISWVVVVLVVAVAHPRRAEIWRPSETHAMPAWWGWAVAGSVAFATGWLARLVWAQSPVEGAGLRFPYVDQPFQLGLVTELRHHFPARFPFVPDEPLQYHWFVHADVAASSWLSGVDAVVLLQRLSPLVMVVLALLGASVLAMRVGGTPLAGVIAPALLVLVGNFNPASSDLNWFLAARLYLSPTHTFGTAVVVLVTWLVLRVLGPGAAPVRVWCVLAVALVLQAGAKATFVPIVIGGAVVVLLLTGLRERRVDRRALGVLALAVVAMGLAQRFVIGFDAPGIGIRPLQSRANLDAIGLGGLQLDALTGAFGTLAYLVPALPLVAGALALPPRAYRDDRRVAFLAGTVAAGVGASYFFDHPDYSQFYFLLSTLVPAAVLAAPGVARAMTAHADGSRRPSVPAVCAVGAVAGVVLGVVLRWSADWSVPVLRAALPVVVVLAVAAGAVALGRRRGRPVGRASGRSAAVLALVGLGASAALFPLVATARDPLPDPWRPPPADQRWQAAMSEGGPTTARWLRDHTSPDDRIASNVHCKAARATWDECDHRSFALSAYSERRVLLEGWAYNPRNARRATEQDLPACCVPFWDPRVLKANDDAFESPTRADLDLLRDRYGVRWLVLNRQLNQDWGPLTRLADRRFASGYYIVFEIR